MGKIIILYTNYIILDNIYDIEDLIASFTDDYELNFELIIKFLARETCAQKGFILVYDEDKNDYIPVVSLNESDHYNINKNVFRTVWKSKKVYLLKMILEIYSTIPTKNK